MQIQKYKPILAVLLGLVALQANNAVAAVNPNDVICQHAAQLECMAEDMKCEIKDHFKGTKGYGKMLAFNALTRAKSAAIVRRVKRDPCYRRLVKDACRLEELVCSMQEQYLEILRCATPNRPVCGDTTHVEIMLADMRAVANCIHVEACCRHDLDPPALIINQTPTFAPGPPVFETPTYEPSVIIEPTPTHRESILELRSQDPTLLPPAGRK